MLFAGSKAYLSKNKVQKLNELRSQNHMSSIKEEIEEEMKKTVVEKKRVRKRSLSRERVRDEDLDKSYSDDEDNAKNDLPSYEINENLMLEDVEISKKQIKPSFMDKVSNFFSFGKKEEEKEKPRKGSNNKKKESKGINSKSDLRQSHSNLQAKGCNFQVGPQKLANNTNKNQITKPNVMPRNQMIHQPPQSNFSQPVNNLTHNNINKFPINGGFKQPQNTVSNHHSGFIPQKPTMDVSQKIGSQNVVYEQEVDFNVLTFDFNFLKEKVSYATGDPNYCKRCEAVLNKYSKLVKGMEDENKYLWICEFCSENNQVFLEQEEIPKEENIDYFIQSFNQLNKGLKDVNYNDEQTVIFCFDVSGSMCVTEPIVGKHKFKGIKENNAELMKFSDGSDQFFVKGSRDMTYVSRLQCLQAAIENNLVQLQTACPNRKIGFVVFNNEVVGIGDGGKNEVKINGNNLNDFEAIKKIGEENTDLIQKGIKDSAETLLKHLYSIEETGQTALGPAILYSINLIKGVSPGSKIVLCTDGIANIGIGSLESVSNKEEYDKAKIFYENLGQMAKEKGIIISLICFEGEESKIEILSLLCEMTGGDIIKVKPSEILTQFSNLLTTEIIATNVKISVKIHKLMIFRNESPYSLKYDGSTLVKDIGNATNETELYVEYNFKASEDIAAKYPEIDLEKIEEIPFQSVVEYTSKAGDRCIRVITSLQKISSDRDEIAKDAKYDILSVNAMKKSSQLAKDGLYRQAQANAYAWKNMIKSNTTNSAQAEESYKMFNKNMKNFNHEIQNIQYKEATSKPMTVSYKDLESEDNTISRKIQRSDKVSNQIYQLSSINMKRAKK